MLTHSAWPFRAAHISAVHPSALCAPFSNRARIRTHSRLPAHAANIRAVIPFSSHIPASALERSITHPACPWCAATMSAVRLLLSARPSRWMPSLALFAWPMNSLQHFSHPFSAAANKSVQVQGTLITCPAKGWEICFFSLAGLAEKRTHWNRCTSLSMAGRLEQRADLRTNDSEQFCESV